MKRIEEEMKRFVLNINGRLVYYKGLILDETDDYYSINEVKLGNMQVFKKNIVIIRGCSDE